MSGTAIANRVVQIVLGVFCLTMIAGGEFQHWEARPDNAVMHYTYTLYSTLSPPPKGPSFCPVLTMDSYAVAFPCDFKPPFIGWLQQRLG